MCYKLWLFSMVLILAACQGAPPGLSAPAPTSLPTALSLPTSTPVPTLTPIPIPTILPTPTPFPEEFSGETQVGDYLMKITCKGTGEPTIILENMLDYTSWISPRFFQISRTCTYPRVGTAGEPAKGPRTTLDQVKDLHALLTQTGVPGPYILVGHSNAGYNLLLYTDQYPKEVVGLVCVDCWHPDFTSVLLKKLGVSQTDTSAEARKIIDYLQVYLNWDQPEDWKNLSEKVAGLASTQQALKVTSLGDRPFVVLVAGDLYAVFTLGVDPILEKVDRVLLEAWIETSGSYSKLSSQGRMELVPGKNQMTILYSDSVTKAVQEVYDKVKKQ